MRIFNLLVSHTALAVFLTLSFSLSAQTEPDEDIFCGADQTDCYFPKLKGKRFALAINHTSRIGSINLADSLCRAGIKPAFIFSPEHGFRGQADAGSSVSDTKDEQTGLDIVSLYGKNKKPSKEQMSGLDAVVFDMQDVGCRFYTYLSTLHYIMIACAENDVELILLDRPNPNDKLSGPVLKDGFQSFVGMHPIPILHGCTLGEMAQMIIGEKWIPAPCRLTIIPVKGWRHGQKYHLSVSPSPNLPNDHAIGLYPSLCLFEGTVISVGRGTESPFEIYGYPDSTCGRFSFVPEPMKGAMNPLYKGQRCWGEDLRTATVPKEFTLSFIVEMFNRSQLGEGFFSNSRFFDLLAGSDDIRRLILQGKSSQEISSTWQSDLERYINIRKKYLIYE